MESRTKTFLPSLADTIFVSIFILQSVGYGARLLGDGDTGYHIRAGQYILEHRTVPKKDIFSFWEPALDWTAHEWLSEVIMAVLHDLAGLTGVTIFFAALLAITCRLLFTTLCEESNQILLAIFIAYFVAISSMLHWLARPHIFSFLITLLWYRSLNRFQYGNKDVLRYLPLVMILWVNLHGGFLLGLVLLAIYCAGNMLSALTEHRIDRSLYWARAKKLAVCAVVCTGATVINPQGFYILLFPFKIMSDTFVLNHVQEFLSPNFHQTLPFKYLLLLLLAVLARSKIALDWIEIALVVAFTYIALFSARYIPLCAIVVAPILLRSAQRMISDLPAAARSFVQARSNNLTRIDRRTFPFLWSAASVALVVLLAMSGNFELKFSEKKFPVAAVEFLKQENLPGRMFNNDEYGDYLIYSAWPQYKVFFDGRSDMYGGKLGGDYLKLVRLEPGWEKITDKHDVGWVFVSSGSSLAAVLSAKQDWRLIYSDTTASVFVRNNATYRRLIEKYPAVELKIKAPELST